MRCLYPIKASRCKKTDTVALWPKAEKDGHDPLEIPCGNCINCRMQDRLGWALRCTLEAAQWEVTTFATLTYNNDNCPMSLELRDLQLFYKRLRRLLGAKKRGRRKLKHFSCGEYGERTGRPHYHALLYGLHPERDKQLIEDAWSAEDDDERKPIGHVRLGYANTGAIHYVVGYQTKKLAEFGFTPMEYVDEETGEIKYLQPPFRCMSKRPAIGAEARKHRHAWRTHAVLDGKTIAVPRFLHKAWKDTATAEEKEIRDWELHQRRQAQPQPPETEAMKNARTRIERKQAHALEKERDREAQEAQALARNKNSRSKRKLN